jgi:hypothetical protein
MVDNTKTTKRFGVLLNIGGHEIPLSGDMLGNLEQQGLDLKLQNPLELGSIDQFAAWASSQGVDISVGSVVKDLPDVFKDLATTIGDARWTVEQAHLNVPPKGKTGVQYTLEVNCSFATPIDLELFTITGVILGVTNEAKPAPLVA